VAIKIKKKKRKPEDDELGIDGLEGEGPSSPLEEEPLPEPDKFVETSVGLSGWFQENWKLVTAVVGAILVAIGGYLIWDHFQDQARIRESSALYQALLAYDTPTQQEVSELEARRQMLAMQLGPDVDIDRVVPTNFSQVYPSAKARDSAVLEAAKSAIDKHPEAEILPEAKLTAAGAAIRLGNPEEAEALASDAAGGLSEDAQIFALQARAAALADQDKIEDAIAVYQEIADRSPRFYGPVALLEVGGLQQHLGNTDAAADAYAEIVARFPEHELAEDASRRLGLLVEDAEERIKNVPVE